MKELFDEDFFISDEINTILYNKAKLYINLFDTIPNDFWNYFISMLNKENCSYFLNEKDIYCELQLPITQFGIYLHNIAYDYCLFKIKNKIYNNIYNLDEYTKDYIYNYISNTKIALKAFINFLYNNYETSNNNIHLLTMNNPNINLNINTSTIQKINKPKIIIIDLFRNINCFLNCAKCDSFKHACFLGHYHCANEYIKQGCIITPKETNAILLSNNLEMCQRMKQSGMKLNKLSLALCCNYACLNSIQFICSQEYIINSSFNYMFYYYNQNNSEKYLKSFEYIYTHFTSVASIIQNYLTKEWFNSIIIDKNNYPILYNSQELVKISNHLVQLFNTSNYYKLF